jgi:hypothetical protein
VAVGLITSYKVSTGNTANTNTLTTPSFTPAVGELIVVKVGSEGLDSPTVGTLSSSAGGLVFTQRDNVATSGKAPVRISTAPVTSSVAMTVQCTFSGASGRHFIVVERWFGAVLDATPSLITTKTGASAPSTTLTTEAPGSVVTWVCTDWDGATGTHTYRSSATETGFEQFSGVYSWYTAYQSAPSAGSQTVGMTAPTQNWSLVGLELQDAGTSATLARQNLAPNPALKVDATGWSAVDSVTGSPLGGWARSTSVGAALPRTTGFEGTTGPLDILPPRAQVVAGRSYYWAVWVRATVDLTANMLVNYYDSPSGGAFVANSGATVPLDLAAGATARFVLGPYTVPAGAVSGYLKLNDLDGGCEVTGYQVEEASTFGAYFDGDSPGAVWDGANGNSTSTIRQSVDAVTVGESFTKTVLAVGPSPWNDAVGIGESFSVTAGTPSSGAADVARVQDGFLISSLEWDPERGRNRVSAFTFGGGVVRARVSRRPVRGGAWELVRGGAVDVVNGRMLRPVDDYEFPSGLDLDYRIEGVTAAGVVVQSATVRRLSVADAVWIKFITQPALNRRLEFMGRSEITRPSRTAVYDVQNRSDPVVVSDVHSSRRMTIRCKTETPADTEALDHALSQGLPCYLQVPETINAPSMYAVIGDYQHEPPARKSMRSIWTIPLVEVAPPPASIVSPGETWANLLVQYPTWEALMAAVPTWLETAD